MVSPLCQSLVAAVLVLTAQAPQPTGDLPRARVTFDPVRQRLVIESPATDLPVGMENMPAMRDVPPSVAVIPIDLSLYSVRVDVVDSAGRELPKAFLHHFNLTIPARRDLFLPIAQRFLAASKETPSVRLPALLVGMPLERDARILVTAMVSNPTPIARHGIRVRVTYGSRSAGLFPLFHAYPWVMDAQFPDERHPGGSPPFDLPPGRSSFSWESRPAIPGAIIGIGGHLHDYGAGLELADVTTGTVLWHATVVRDSTGRMLSLPVTRFYNWRRLGIPVEPTHRYRITATYENPTGHTLHEAGMGSVAGLFIPSRSVPWPGVDTGNVIYRQDLAGVTEPHDMSHMEMSP
jgi:hypothetical protein